MTWLDLALPLCAYLLGSVATAIVVTRLLGLPDPRTMGSGNPGATNVLRTGSKGAAFITLLGDMLKGLLPVVMARLLEVGELTLMATALAAFLGHIYPVFFQFRGGKGVATALGVLLGLAPWLGLAVLGVWLLVAATLRYSSLAALIAAATAPVIAWGLGLGTTAITGVAFMSALLIARHRSNIQRLLAGTESRIGAKKGA
ncbi:MAG: glycerol-3-phosphate 1-O-acyltransferase PlsY [Gammaproteobacteria bacterium]|nr:glycerol-3-phosphate 1-O-acyltransferase PlsY [Gammaproteobacteria bacterium]